MPEPIFHVLSGGPRPVAPFSHAVESDGWVFVTGQMPNDSDDHARPLPAGIEAQTRQVMRNLKRVLGGVKLDFSHVLFARVYLTHFAEDYAAMNSVYASYFAPDRRPARTCIGVTGLALNARVEIDLLAKRNSEDL
jgi:reactive intermediate/imine deaminase